MTFFSWSASSSSYTYSFIFVFTYLYLYIFFNLLYIFIEHRHLCYFLWLFFSPLVSSWAIKSCLLQWIVLPLSKEWRTGLLFSLQCARLRNQCCSLCRSFLARASSRGMASCPAGWEKVGYRFYKGKITLKFLN